MTCQKKCGWQKREKVPRLTAQTETHKKTKISMRWDSSYIHKVLKRLLEDHACFMCVITHKTRTFCQKYSRWEFLQLVSRQLFTPCCGVKPAHTSCLMTEFMNYMTLLISPRSFRSSGYKLSIGVLKPFWLWRACLCVCEYVRSSFGTLVGNSSVLCGWKCEHLSTDNEIIRAVKICHGRLEFCVKHSTLTQGNRRKSTKWNTCLPSTVNGEVRMDSDVRVSRLAWVGTICTATLR